MTLPVKNPAPTMMALPTFTGIFKAMTDAFKLRPRDSQLTLADHVRAGITAKEVSVIEAPTGTGKTLGYLAGALDAQAHAGDIIPIVVATATVGLQEQILRHDIPRLAAVGAVDPRKVAVAKGRGRYFCPRTASLLADKKREDNQFDMFQPDKQVADAGVPIALEMLRAWRTEEWDGDRDSWPGDIPRIWESSCGASSDTCVNRACEHFDRCPYMKSRLQLSQASVIVANHDIVLADLACRAEEEAATVLPVKAYSLIIDEAHNFPEKAIGTMRASADLTSVDWLRKLEQYGETVLSTAAVNKALSHHAEFSKDVFSVGAANLISEMDRVARIMSKREYSKSGISSWGLQKPDEDLLREITSVAVLATSLHAALKVTAKAYSEIAENAGGSEKAFAIRMLAQTHLFNRQAKDLFNGMRLFCSDEHLVRWIERRQDGRITLHAQPMEGAEVLQRLLWSKEMCVTMLSATLQIAGSFKRFSDKIGLPGGSNVFALPPVFDYSRGFLHQPPMETEPGEPGHENELVDRIEKLYRANVAPGILVLFTSRETMRRVTRALDPEICERVLVQDGRPVPELIAQHRERIDNGERSVLAGLDSMAEGLDLPGKYCGHVVITKLPFQPPGDPVEEARRESMGENWFDQAYLADMLTMLIQACGRLIRREDDHGVITCLDKRLRTRRYSATARMALPAFTGGAKIKAYFEMAAERGFDLSHGTAKKVAPKLELVAKAPEIAQDIREAPKVEKSVPVDPLAAVMRQVHLPAPVHPSVSTSIDSLPGTLARLVPFIKGPFPEGEAPYLSESKTLPCLPVGTPAYVWAERQVPHAVMLGLRIKNGGWSSAVPAWLQVLCMRPDIIQYVDVLRSHLQGRESDERTDLLTPEVCQSQIERGLAGLGLPGMKDAVEALNRLEAEVLVVLSNPFSLPSKDLLLEMVQSAQQLATSHRAKK